MVGGGLQLVRLSSLPVVALLLPRVVGVLHVGFLHMLVLVGDRPLLPVLKGIGLQLVVLQLMLLLLLLLLLL
jgi:hypothetical protein